MLDFLYFLRGPVIFSLCWFNGDGRFEGSLVGTCLESLVLVGSGSVSVGTGQGLAVTGQGLVGTGSDMVITGIDMAGTGIVTGNGDTAGLVGSGIGRQFHQDP